jgi:hypothetical protein
VPVRGGALSRGLVVLINRLKDEARPDRPSPGVAAAH